MLAPPHLPSQELPTSCRFPQSLSWLLCGMTTRAGPGLSCQVTDGMMAARRGSCHVLVLSYRPPYTDLFVNHQTQIFYTYYICTYMYFQPMASCTAYQCRGRRKTPSMGDCCLRTFFWTLSSFFLGNARWCPFLFRLTNHPVHILLSLLSHTQQN